MAMERPVAGRNSGCCRVRHFSWARKFRAALPVVVIMLVVAGCGGGGGGSHDGPSGSTSSTGLGVPTSGSGIVGVVPAQSSARLAFLAGNDAAFGYRDGPATDALFYGVSAIAVDGSGNRYLADSSNLVIRKIDTSGNVTTYAGTPGVYGDVDGAASSAQFKTLLGMAIDASGNLFVTEDSNVVREITVGGQVTTLAGVSGQSGSSDGTGAAARFNVLGAVATDANGNVFVVDSSYLTIREITPMGVVTTIFGTAGVSGQSSANPALGIRIVSLAFDGSNDLFFVDGNALREIAQGGTVSTVNSSLQPLACANPVIAWNGNGFAAVSNCNLFDLSVTGAISLLYTFPKNSLGGGAVAVDTAGNIYVPENNGATDEIYEYSPTGAQTLLAGESAHYGDIDGTGSAASFGLAGNTQFSVLNNGIASDSSGNLYVADSGNNTIRKVTPGGVVTTLAGHTQVDGNGNLVSGFADGLGSAARFSDPTGIVVNSAGMIYVADTGNQVIRQITPQGMVTTLAGVPASPGYQGQRSDGSGAHAQFSVPGPMAIDKSGNLYVGDNAYVILTGHAEPTDLNGTTIRKITPAGVVTTIAGNSSTPGVLDGPVATAQFELISAIAIDPVGNIFAVDNGTIRKITDGYVKTAYSPRTGALALVIDATGNFYYSSFSPSEIGRIDTAGNTTIYAGSAADGLRPGSLPGGLNAPTALTIYGNGLAVMMAGGVATIQ